MKTYWKIQGIHKSSLGKPCIAFFKHDGSNLRFEWSKKRGWYKFGTRRRLFDESDIEYGRAINTFNNKFADEILKVLKDKKYRGVDKCIVFCEFEGKNSFAGYHDWNEHQDLILIDVCPLTKGIIPPRQFIKDFGHLHIPEIIYEGNFNKEFISDVREGHYKSLKEGVVAKGVLPGKHTQHSLWMTKVKTLWWLNELKKRATIEEKYKLTLTENKREQEFS